MKYILILLALFSLLACNDSVSNSEGLETTTEEGEEGSPGDIDGSRETNGSESNEFYVKDESGKIFLKYYFERMHITYKTTSTMPGMSAGRKEHYWDQYGWNELVVDYDTVNNTTSYMLINGDMGYFWDEGSTSYYKQQSFIAPYYYLTKPSTATLEEDAKEMLEGLGFSYEKDTTILGLPCEKFSGSLGTNTIWRRGMQSLSMTIMGMSEEFAVAIDSTSALDEELFALPPGLTLQVEEY